mmetsp:Transcript_21632/g.60372  ORF Transcript_21632/g.60372 Transcript_21632/m.60372 type:complete len:258 (-) Transcript_21632:454-1227(-)
MALCASSLARTSRWTASRQRCGSHCRRTWSPSNGSFPRFPPCQRGAPSFATTGRGTAGRPICPRPHAFSRTANLPRDGGVRDGRRLCSGTIGFWELRACRSQSSPALPFAAGCFVSWSWRMARWTLEFARISVANMCPLSFCDKRGAPSGERKTDFLRFQRMRRARTTASGQGVVSRKLSILVCTTIGVTMSFSVLMALSSAEGVPLNIRWAATGTSRNPTTGRCSGLTGRTMPPSVSPLGTRDERSVRVYHRGRGR